MTMATLYDLELQESNNMIHLFVENGLSASLRLLRDQKDMAGAMGEIGAKIIHDLEDASTDLGKSYARLTSLEKDVQEAMAKIELTQELAVKAHSVFQRNPSSLDDLNDQERAVIQDYWIKKKACIAELTKKGYEYKELFS